MLNKDVCDEANMAVVMIVSVWCWQIYTVNWM